MNVAIHGLANAQEPEDAPKNILRYDTGVVTNNTYTNECLGFSFTIPPGWQSDTNGGGMNAGTATHLARGGLGLLDIHRLADRISLFAHHASHSSLTARDDVTAETRTQIKFDPANRELLRDTFAVEYGGKQFYRSDYKEVMNNGSTTYRGSVYTKFRNYLLAQA